MHRTTVMGALITVALFGSLALIATGCSKDNSLTNSPDVALPGSGFDSYPPATPCGLQVMKATDDGFKLMWMPNSEPDLAGYRVFYYNPNPFREDSYVCAHGDAVVATDFYTFTADLSYGTHYFTLAAVDTDGNVSPRCAPIEFSYSESAQGDVSPEGGQSGSETIYPGRVPQHGDPIEPGDQQGQETF